MEQNKRPITGSYLKLSVTLDTGVICHWKPWEKGIHFRSFPGCSKRFGKLWGDHGTRIRFFNLQKRVWRFPTSGFNSLLFSSLNFSFDRKGKFGDNFDATKISALRAFPIYQTGKIRGDLQCYKDATLHGVFRW
jgi:hypothetical protein